MKRIRYVSRSARPLGPDVIDDIVAASHRNNPALDVTGVLVVAGDLFFQVLEGPDDAVTALYEKIARDPRHDRVLMLDVEEGEFDRLCPDWAMGRLDLTRNSAAHLAPVRALLEVVFAQQRLINDAVRALEEFTWQGMMDVALQDTEPTP